MNSNQIENIKSESNQLKINTKNKEVISNGIPYYYVVNNSSDQTSGFTYNGLVNQNNVLQINGREIPNFGNSEAKIVKQEEKNIKKPSSDIEIFPDNICSTPKSYSHLWNHLYNQAK